MRLGTGTIVWSFLRKRGDVRRPCWIIVGLAGLWVGLVSALTAVPASGSSGITINTILDIVAVDGHCSLREAILAANQDTASGPTAGECKAGGTNDVIIIPQGVYTLTRSGYGEDEGLTGDLDIRADLVLASDGSGPVVIDGNQLDRVIDVGVGVTVTLSGLTIQNGLTIFLPSGPYWDGAGVFNRGTLRVYSTSIVDNVARLNGGGIANNGLLVLVNSIVSGNQDALGAGGILNFRVMRLENVLVFNNRSVGKSGGISSQAWTGGVSVIRDSAIVSNTGSWSGGLYHSYEPLVIENTTISGNQGSGIHTSEADGLIVLRSSVISNTDTGLYASAPVTVAHSTISGNLGSGVRVETPELIGLYNVTIAHNGSMGIENGYGSSSIRLQNTLVGGNASADCLGMIFSLGHNLIQDTSDCILTGVSTGNVLNVVPLLGPLQNNGGLTDTHALLPGSVGIDDGNPAGCQGNNGVPRLFDQRGLLRIADGDGDGSAVCDIGAYELFAGPALTMHLPLLQR